MVIGIRPGYGADEVVRYLNEAARTAGNLLGRGDIALADYLNWATEHLRTLGPSIAPSDMDELITSRRYWTLLGSLELATATVPGLIQLMQSNSLNVERR